MSAVRAGNLVSMTRLARSPRLAGRRRQRRRSGRPGCWRLQDAKARFSELVRRAQSEGPQHVSVHGHEEVVVIDADEFRRLTGDRSGQALIDAMQASPDHNADLEVPRVRLPVRDIRL
jgi:prevent-host-death family protein